MAIAEFTHNKKREEKLYGSARNLLLFSIYWFVEKERALKLKIKLTKLAIENTHTHLMA